MPHLPWLGCEPGAEPAPDLAVRPWVRQWGRVTVLSDRALPRGPDRSRQWACGASSMGIVLAAGARPCGSLPVAAIK